MIAWDEATPQQLFRAIESVIDITEEYLFAKAQTTKEIVQEIRELLL